MCRDHLYRTALRLGKKCSCQPGEDVLNNLHVPIRIGFRLTKNADNIHRIVKGTAIQSERLKHFLEECHRCAVMLWINRVLDLPVFWQRMLFNLNGRLERPNPLSYHSFKLGYKH